MIEDRIVLTKNNGPDHTTSFPQGPPIRFFFISIGLSTTKSKGLPYCHSQGGNNGDERLKGDFKIAMPDSYTDMDDTETGYRGGYGPALTEISMTCS